MRHGMMLSESKKLLLRWAVWFCLGNLILLWMVCYKYFDSIPWVHSVYAVPFALKVLSISFFMAGYIGHLGVLALLPLLIVVPAIFVFPNRAIIFALTIFLSAITVGFVFADSIVYSLYHYHINGVLFNLIFDSWDKQVLGLSA